MEIPGQEKMRDVHLRIFSGKIFKPPLTKKRFRI